MHCFAARFSSSIPTERQALRWKPIFRSSLRASGDTALIGASKLTFTTACQDLAKSQLSISMADKRMKSVE